MADRKTLINRDIQKAIDDLSEHEYNLLTRNGETDVFGVPVDYEDSYEYDDDSTSEGNSRLVQHIPVPRSRYSRRK